MAPPTRRPAPAELLDASARASYRGVLPLVRRLREAGHEAWLVGGGVRDLLLGRDVADWDVATSAPPEAVTGLWPEAVPTGIRHGTVTVPLPGGPVEVTTYRAEGPYTDGRRPDWVRFGASLEEDLSRRDFTINAMALDPEAGILVDPFGGEADLGDRSLRTVGDPDRRFKEDGLRPLRGIRLAAVLELAVDPETLAAMGRNRDRVAGVARERVRDELVKLLAAPRASVGIELMRRTGILAIVIPELLEGVGVEQNRFHAYDIYEHTLRTLDAAPAGAPVVRLAALLHDVGKPRTRRVVDGEGTFHDHENVGARMSRQILDRLRFPHAERDRVSHLVAQHMFFYTPEWSDAAVRRFIRRVGRENLEDLFRLRRADTEAHGVEAASDGPLEELEARIEAVLAAEEALDVTDLAVSGEDVMKVMGIGSGPEVGRILDGLLDRVIEEPGRNTRENLIRILEELRGTG
jgi:tRNA nucleotidyltransferase (CCA-adding enzyme)